MYLIYRQSSRLNEKMQCLQTGKKKKTANRVYDLSAVNDETGKVLAAVDLWFQTLHSKCL